MSQIMSEDLDLTTGKITITNGRWYKEAASIWDQLHPPESATPRQVTDF